MPKTLLAVDDSATMRKVLEISFAGEDFRVVTADGASSAIARIAEDPIAAVIDTSLGADDGYALAKQVRAKNARIAIILLASRYTPYDANRGRDAGADDFIDKPFDTQALIDKVKKAVLARETAKAAPVQAPAPAPAGIGAGSGPAFAPPARSPVAPSISSRASFPTQRTHTLSFEGGPVAPPAAAAPAISRTAPSGVPIAQPPPVAASVGATSALPSAHNVPTAAPPRAADAASPATAVNGQFAGKLGDLGLTSAQVEAVLALSREVVERVVWEVVPQLAETMIKEEITRLTREG